MKRKMIEEAVQIPSSAKRKGQNLIKGIEELYRISETKPNDWLQMYDENDWSFYIKDYKFNDKNMTFTWKERNGSTRADNNVYNQKEKFVANGEFDFYGEFNDFVNYWNKLVRKTKKYYEMDSTELDRKLGYDVDDDELDESKKVVKKTLYEERELKDNLYSKEFFNKFINYLGLKKSYFGRYVLANFIDDEDEYYGKYNTNELLKIAENLLNYWIENEWINEYAEGGMFRTIEESKKVVKESMKDYEQSKNEILDAYRNLDEEDLSYVQQIKELCEKAEKLYDNLEPTDEESKIIWDEIDPSGYTGYEEQLVDIIIAIDILLSLRKGTFKNSKPIKEELKRKFNPNYEFTYSEDFLNKLLDKFNEEYDFLYDNKDNVSGYREAVKAYDEDVEDDKFANLVRDFVQFRGDVMASDRECAAFEFACEDLGLFADEFKYLY